VLSAIEAVVFLSLTLFVFFKNGVIEFFRRVFSDPNLTFLLIFSLIFAFAVGISSGNFGALSRYKIPCMPFYGAFLMILINYEKLKRGKQTQRRTKKSISAVPPVMPNFSQPNCA
jgi:hypothetical protein